MTRMEELADELEAARTAYLDSMEAPREQREQARKAYEQLMWDNKATFILALRAAAKRC